MKSNPHITVGTTSNGVAVTLTVDTTDAIVLNGAQVKDLIEELSRRRQERGKSYDKLDAALSPRQKDLRRVSGTPAEFARGIYQCVPGDISMDEARAALDRYIREWNAASSDDAARRPAQ